MEPGRVRNYWLLGQSWLLVPWSWLQLPELSWSQVFEIFVEPELSWSQEIFERGGARGEPEPQSVGSISFWAVNF